MIPAIQELNFPKKEGKQYATLAQATVSLADMGEKTITTQVKIDGEIVPDFSYDWAVTFQGEKYIMPLRIPQGAKENTSLNATIDLTFQHWAIYQLKRWTFVTMQPIEAGTYMADEEVADVQLNLRDFCDLFGQVLEYYYGDSITIDLNPKWEYDKTAVMISISHSYIWDVLIKFHELFGVRWAIEPREDNDNEAKGGERYVIKVGYPTTEVDHIFEYGFEGGLLKLERQVQSEEIRNMIKGRGGETNIPYRYFKDTDPNNKNFRPDPDWVEELKSVPFTNLRGATFRSYVQGWKAAHISKYPGYKAVGEDNAYAPWAYRKGFTDTKFHPEEFVADEITINPREGDTQTELLPGYSPFIKKDSSIAKYGPLPATLDNNDDIYPTIQGTGLDIAVDVEQIESDDVAESVENDSQVTDYGEASITIDRDFYHGDPVEFRIILDCGYLIEVPDGTTADLEVINATVKAKRKSWLSAGYKKADSADYESDYRVEVINTRGEAISSIDIPAGRYTFRVLFNVRYKAQPNPTLKHKFTASFAGAKLTSSTLGDQWHNTFDIWVKNIWGTEKGVDEDGKAISENDEQYATRVWTPVLGDKEGSEAAVVFTSGALVHEDYEFKIPSGAWPVYDTSKTYKDENGVTHTSHWRIKLAKSDAELEATGLYVPSTQKQGKAGDTFVFIGTEMTHVPYVVNAEIALDNWKKDHLGEVKEIKPTFVVTTDRVRLNNEGRPDALINQLRVGNSIRLADKRFIQPLPDLAYEILYLQSITYTYREPSSSDAALNPDVEIVLGEEYATSANPVSVMQGEIGSMQRLLGSISNVEQIVRAVGDKLYLRKDGISDISYSPTRFFSLLTNGDFRAGIVGGTGWGFFKDENGNWTLEADRVNVRQEMQVNTLVINQAEGRGGMEIDTGAFMTVTKVVESENGYVCYFDQKNGSVANLFHVDDVAYNNRWDVENADLKFYKRRVVAVGVDHIVLAKSPEEGGVTPEGWPDSGVNGTRVPEPGDVVIHYGNYSDEDRRYVKVRDIVGGGYERYIEGLDGVNSNGVEYYFVGRQEGMYNGKPRWFIGNDSNHIEYVNGELNIKARLSVLSTVGDKTLGEIAAGGAMDIDIGGRNYARGTGKEWVAPEGVLSDGFNLVVEAYAVYGLASGDEVTLSFDYEARGLAFGEEGFIQVQSDKEYGYVPGQQFMWENGTGHFEKTYVLGGNTTDRTTKGRVVFRFDWVQMSQPGGYFKVWNLKMERGNVATDWSPAPEDSEDAVEALDYLKKALKANTVVDGGLVMGSMLKLGTWAESEGDPDKAVMTGVYAGMNGVYGGERTIASWWGGDMVDRFDRNGVTITPVPTGAASALIRMDGTGYLAQGNIKWNESGEITANKISIQSGLIAGFEIKGNFLTNEGLGENSQGNDATIILRDKNNGTYAGIGPNIIPSSMGRDDVISGRFASSPEEDLDPGLNFDSDPYTEKVSYGLMVSASGRQGNVALSIGSGCVSGMAMRNTIIKTYETARDLKHDDYNVLAFNTKECVLTLPQMTLADDGHVIRFKNMNGALVKIQARACYTIDDTVSPPVPRVSVPVIKFDRDSTVTPGGSIELQAIGDAYELVWVRDRKYVVNGVMYYGMWVQYKFPRDW